MSPYISLAVLVIIIIWQGCSLMKLEAQNEKIREAIRKTIQNEESKTKERLLHDFLEEVCNALYN